MESISDGEALDDGIFGLLSSVEIGIDVFDLVEDGGGLVAVDISLFVVGFEGVGFDDEEGIIVECGDLSGFPCEEVHVDMTVPLGDDGGFSAIDHQEAVEDDDYGPVGFIGSAADVDDSEISIDDFVGVVLIAGGGEVPYGEHPLGIGFESEVAQSIGSFIDECINVAEIAGMFFGGES